MLQSVIVNYTAFIDPSRLDLAGRSPKGAQLLQYDFNGNE